MSGGAVYGEAYAVIPETVLYAEVSSNAKILWAIFARHADPDGRCYPGLRRLATLMGCSEDTVRRAKSDLVKAKLIECHDRYDADGRRTTDDVILRGRPSKSATYGGSKSATYGGSKSATPEVKPEEEPPNHEVVSRGSDSSPGKNSAPSTTVCCDHCKATGLLLRVGATWNPRTGDETPGLSLCPTCYDNAAIP